MAKTYAFLEQTPSIRQLPTLVKLSRNAEAGTLSPAEQLLLPNRDDYVR
jgi:hypothetical protein